MFASQWEDFSGKGIGEQVYSGAATFGLFMANIAAIIGSIVGLLMIGFGVKFWVQKEKYSAETQGRIVDAQCATVTEGKEPKQQCLLKVEYVVDGNPYVHEATRSDRFYAKDYKVAIRYDPDRPQDASMDGSAKTMGKILVGIGFLIVIGVWVSWYIKRRFKFAAAASGVGTAFNMIRTS
jgi:hypothetical protein